MKQQSEKGKFALIAHPLDMDMYREYIRFLKPDKTYKDQLLLKLFEWTPSYKVKEWRNYSLDNIAILDGVMIMVPFIPEMKDIKIREVTSKIEQALSIAKENDCTVAALGAFTSIVMQGKEEQLSARYNMKITSGNTLTATLIIKSIENIAGHFEMDLKYQTVAIIGASGDIGMGCMTYFGDKVKKMILTARGIDSLEKVVRKHEEKFQCETEITDNNSMAVDNSQIVIFVTSAYQPLFSIDDFKPGTVVCDASAPLNVKTNGKLRDDIFMYHGGIASIPMDLSPGFSMGCAVGSFYGCQLEGVMLAADNSLPHSWGRGNIKKEEIEVYLKNIKSNSSIEVAFTIGDKVYSKKEMELYRSHWLLNRYH